MPRRKLKVLKNLRDYAQNNTTKTAAAKAVKVLKDAITGGKGKENKQPVLSFHTRYYSDRFLTVEISHQKQKKNIKRIRENASNASSVDNTAFTQSNDCITRAPTMQGRDFFNGHNEALQSVGPPSYHFINEIYKHITANGQSLHTRSSARKGTFWGERDNSHGRV